jgi:hypothetical protein
MSSVNDPAQAIANVISAEWSTTTGGLKPVIDKEWYSAIHSQVLSTDGRTKETRHVSVREIAASHEVFGALVESVSNELQIDIWAGMDAAARQMRDEVKRILRSKANDPATGINFVTGTSWRDSSAFDEGDQLYRYSATIQLEYEEE